MTIEIAEPEVVITLDPNRMVRFVCIDGLTREANAEELTSILEHEERGARDALDYHTSAMRQQRTALLSASDWVELPSATSRLNAEHLAAWTTYRQALRDVPEQEGFPWTHTWPSQPIW